MPRVTPVTATDSDANPGALWLPEGDRAWRAGAWSVGPWDPRALHGGPVAALLARALEGCDAPGPMHPANFHLDLLRPVGLGPHRIETTVTRAGRKVQLAQAELIDATSDATVARARAVRIRILDGAAAAELATLTPDGLATDVQASTPTAATPRSGQAPPGFRPDEPPAFHNRAVEHDFTHGHLADPGPATDWIRLVIPVVPGETPSPLQRVVAAADFGNGISATLDFATHTFVNPDLTVTLHRLPEGEWVCVDARTRLGTPGVAVAEADLSDRLGPIGRSVQTLVVEHR